MNWLEELQARVPNGTAGNIRERSFLASQLSVPIEASIGRHRVPCCRTHQDHHWISVQAACRPESPSSCCAPLALLRGGSRVARTAPRQDAPLTFGPCHVRCYCAPSPPATAPARPPVQVAHPLPPALRERKGNHAHNGQEKRNGKQHQRQARRGDPSRQDNRHHLAEHPHGRRRVLQRPHHPPFPPRRDRSPPRPSLCMRAPAGGMLEDRPRDGPLAPAQAGRSGLFRISRSVRSVRTSFRSRRSCAHSSVVRPVRPLERSARARSNQVRSADSVQAVLQ